MVIRKTVSGKECAFRVTLARSSLPSGFYERLISFTSTPQCPTDLVLILRRPALDERAGTSGVISRSLPDCLASTILPRRCKIVLLPIGCSILNPVSFATSCSNVGNLVRPNMSSPPTAMFSSQAHPQPASHSGLSSSESDSRRIARQDMWAE
jgi:hypothetical protein